MRWTATHASCRLSHMSAASRLSPVTVAELNALDEAAFVELLGSVVEHAPWVALRAWSYKPFDSDEGLYNAFAVCIQSAAQAHQLVLLRSHPELAGREAIEGSMTPDSSAEQSRLGLMALSPGLLARLNALNHAYQARFGYPFIVALRLHDSLESVLRTGEERLRNDADAEWPMALQQVCEVMRGRLTRLVQAAQAHSPPVFS